MKGWGRDGSGAMYAETPNGIFTSSGVWFHVTEAALEGYAGPVLAREPLPVLLARSERWLRSAQTLAVWALPLLLVLVPPLSAVLATLTLFVGWRALSPAFTSRVADAVLQALDLVWLQGAYYVFVLSIFAERGQLALVGIGLAGFVLLRWGLVDRLAQPLVRRIWASLFPLPVADQVLRGFIIRAALAYGLSLPHLDRMEDAIRRRLGRSS